MNGIKILGVGQYLPEIVVTNKMFESYMDTNDEWIVSRTGISERRMSKEKANFEMAAEAAKAALEAAGKKASDIDIIILSTCSPDFFYPNTACLVQKLIGADGCVCFDINTACTGFITALDIARAYLETGAYKTALVIASERLHTQLDYEDRGSAILFGDGAGAAVVEKQENALYYSHMGAYGDMLESLYCKANYEPNCPFVDDERICADILDTEKKNKYLQMDGKAVYKFAVDAMASGVEKVLKQSGLTMDDLDLVIPHQANIRIIQSALKKMGAPDEKIYINLSKRGNTSSACIPTCLSELWAEGKLKKGMKICLVGFGAGLTYGAIVFEF